MNSELEAKFKIEEDDVKTLINRLKKLKAGHRYDRLEINTFFDRKKLHRNKNELLRLREAKSGKNTEYIVTFKRKKKRDGDGLKYQDEFEYTVSCGEKFSQVLENMGYEKVFLFEKKRRSYLLDNCLVEIDEIPQLGFFCEVEGANSKAIEQVLARIGYSDAKLISIGYGTLIKKYLNKNSELRF